jgi:hydrophobe/amphiphile efflux-1 (HAE1) family protein
MFSKFFIDRPVFASVLSILIVIGGVLSLLGLPVAQFPEIAPPTIEVKARYPGASAQSVAQSVAAPIEQQLSGAKGLLYFQSQSANDGSCVVTVTFEIGTDLELAAVEVQNRVKLAESRLPQAVLQQGLEVRKKSTSILLVAALTSDDPRFTALDLNNYATINVVDALKRVPGVGDASVYGAGDYAMRLWVNPAKMAQKGLAVSDLSRAVQEQNGLYAAGRIGQQPSPAFSPTTVPVITRGRLEEPGEFENIVLRAEPDGSILRIRDVGRAELGSLSYDLFGRLNAKPSTLIIVNLQPGANALSTADGVRSTLAELSRSFPAGVRQSIPYDTTRFIRVSIDQVLQTFMEAAILVLVVVFVFLQSFRATLVPLLAVPVSIVGTFIAMSVLGFTVNTLTLFGLVLAIGVVVDDAIVVIENVERLMHEEGLAARDATVKSMQQVTGPVIATTLVLVAVFVPVAFLGGLTGQLYRQFAVTIAASVCISSLVALTLSPAMCRLLIKPRAAKKAAPFRVFDAALDRLTAGYARVVGLTLRGAVVGVVLFAVCCAGAWWLFKRTPTGFIPSEDQGVFLVAVQLPDGASLERNDAVTRDVEAFLLEQPEVESVVVLGGQNILAGSAAQTNATAIFVTLKPWDQRTAKGQNVDALVGRVYARFAGDLRATVLPFNPPPVPGLGQRAGFELQLQARAGSDIADLDRVSAAFVSKLDQRPETTAVSRTLSVGQPQLYVDLDEEQAKVSGVAVDEVFSTLQALFGSLYINDFSKFGRVYRVQLQAEPEFRSSPQDLTRVYVRSARGAMVPLSSVLTTNDVAGPTVVSRFNGFPAVQIAGAPGAGFSTGDTLRVVRELGADLPEGYGFEFSGQSYQEVRAGGQAGLLMLVGLVVVFLVLAAQYESFALPVSVLLAVPLGALGAFAAIWYRSLPMDVYFQIGLLTLIGLSAKNAILIVEFAAQERRAGKSAFDAAVTASRLRLRPLLMTALSFVLGVIPLMIASGAGAAGQNSIGTGVFGGMLGATILAVFFVPLWFFVIDRLTSRRAVPSPGSPAPPPGDPGHAP